MLAEPAGVKAPGAWHPPKRPPTSAPAPLLGLPTAAPLFLSLPLLSTCAGDLNSKYFVRIISFFCVGFPTACLGGRGQLAQTPIHLRTCHMEEASEGLRKKLVQLCICRDCLTFKLPRLK